MVDILIITEILKYFDFEELCIAEQINPNFKSSVRSELHRLRLSIFVEYLLNPGSKLWKKFEHIVPACII
uniref:Maturase K n=1 Tax=Romanomermis culicivorax TaxID=13658 RepID=A0A915IX65_ROMCU